VPRGTYGCQAPWRSRTYRSRTYPWRVRLVDFDQPKGTITNKVDRLDYRVLFED
jgi:hypothetical protein